MLVHDSVEVRVVGHVVDMAVDVVVHPPRRDGEEGLVARPAVQGFLQTRPIRRPSSSSIQWRTGRCVPALQCTRQPIFAVAITSVPPASSAATLLALRCRDKTGGGL